MSFLSVENLSVRINGNEILEGVSFEIDRGQIVSVIGPNGSGKTTMVRAILGLVDYSGRILLDGGRIENQYERVGYVPQRFDFDRSFPLSVREFLALPVARPDAKWKAEVMRVFGVEALADKMLGTLSGGQMQRTLIAAAMLKQPQLLILDEPTSGVDMEGVASFYDLIRHINREHNITVILISHEVNMVFKTSSKVICLNRNMLCCGDPQAVLSKELLTRLYGSDMEMRGHPH